MKHATMGRKEDRYGVPMQGFNMQIW